MDWKRIAYCLIVALLTAISSVVTQDDLRSPPPNEMPSFAKDTENVTVPIGREAVLSCVIHNLGNYKVAWVRVDTQTILTIDDAIITRSQRVSVRHMTDASIDPHRHHHHHPHHKKSHPPGTDVASVGNNNIPLSSNSPMTSYDGRAYIHKTWQLIIRDVQSSDSGLYMCQLNTEPMTSQTAFLGVTVPPDIVDSESSGDVMVTEGQNTTLRCSATGHPLPTITWRREDGRPIQNHALTTDGPVLQLTRIPRQSIGAYLCIASNGVPPSVSKRFVLRVQFAPSVSATNQLVGARQADTNVTLECHCESYPRPVVYWLRHGTNDVVVNGGRYREEKRETNHYKVAMQLTFLRLEREDFMTYQCVCRNTLGIADSVVRLYQIAPVIGTELNEVYSDSEEGQQDGRFKDQTILAKSKEESSKRISGNKPIPGKTALSTNQAHCNSPLLVLMLMLAVTVTLKR